MEILEILSSGGYVSGEEIARKMGISRAAVHKHVLKLRAGGYGIHGEHKRGYMIVSRPDILSPAELERYFSKEDSARYHIYYKESDLSTQVTAKELAGRGKKEGAVVIAEEQTKAYGRLDREWSSGRGGIWFSMVLRPEVPPERISQLTLASSVAVCRALERKLGLEPEIKWPNDIMIGEKKLAGILTEMSAEVGRVRWVVIGIGINANNELPFALKDAVSLKTLVKADVNRAELLAGILEEFGRLYDAYGKKGFKALSREYNRRSTLPGKRVRVNWGNEVSFGTVEKIDADGCLRLLLSGGIRKKIIAGDVTLLKG